MVGGNDHRAAEWHALGMVHPASEQVAKQHSRRVPGQPVTFNLRNSSEGFLSGTSNAGTMTTTADSEGNLFLVPAFVVEV